MAFQDRVEKMRKELREEGTPKRSSPGSTPTNVSILSSVSKPDPSNLPKISEQFRPKLGSWECKACYTMNGAKDSSCVSCDSPREKPKSPGPAEVKPGPSLAEMFKPKAGSWECGGCLIVNDADKTICVCCNTPKPGHENDAKESPKSVISFGSSSFSLGINPADDKGTCFNFGIKPTSDAQKSSFTFRMNKPETKSGKAMESQSSSGGPDLGQSSLENKDIDKSKTVSMSGFTFGQSPSPFTFASKTEVLTSSTDSTTPISFETKAPGSGFKFDNLFGDKARTPTKTSISFGATSESTGDKFAFGQSGKFDCNFSRVTKSQSSSKSPRSPATGKETDSEPGDTEEGEGFKDLVFKPVVPLPDKVPLTTGEEDEEVLYSHRAKLYRFSQGEWKERGVGDIKILRHNVTRKIRLLMRREPILKICLNHLLSTDQVFSPKDDRSWYWKAQDYIEGELRNEVFCLRVKSPEIAQDFKRAVESAQGEVEALKSVSSGSSPSTAESDGGTRGEGEDVSHYEVGDYFLKTKQFHNVHFIVGQQQERIPAVRALLINQSRVWWSMLAKESPLAEKGNIVVPDVEPGTFRLLLKHCYGALEDCSGLSDDEVLDLSRCAHKYQMSTLKLKIAASLNPKDVDEVFHALHCLAHYNLGVDNEAVKKIVQTQTLEIFEHPQFLGCHEDSITYITKQDCLSCEEIQLWKAVVKWAKNKAGTDEGPKIRESMVGPLQHIRLLTLCVSELCKHVFTTAILSSDEIASICKKSNVPKTLCDKTEIRKTTQEATFKVELKHDTLANSQLLVGPTTCAFVKVKMENIFIKHITCVGFPNIKRAHTGILTKYFNENLNFIFQDKDSIGITIRVSRITNLHSNTSDEEPTVINLPHIEFHYFDRLNIPVNIVLRANCKYKIELKFNKDLPCLKNPECELGHEFEHGLFYCSPLYDNGVGIKPCHIVGFKYQVGIND